MISGKVVTLKLHLFLHLSFNFFQIFRFGMYFNLNEPIQRHVIVTNFNAFVFSSHLLGYLEGTKP